MDVYYLHVYTYVHDTCMYILTHSNIGAVANFLLVNIKQRES